jgi:hypothetical protein
MTAFVRAAARDKSISIIHHGRDHDNKPRDFEFNLQILYEVSTVTHPKSLRFIYVCKGEE